MGVEGGVVGYLGDSRHDRGVGSWRMRCGDVERASAGNSLYQWVVKYVVLNRQEV